MNYKIIKEDRICSYAQQQGQGFINSEILALSEVTVEPLLRWLSFRLDVIITTYVTILSFALIPLSKSQKFSELFGISAGSVGLMLSIAQNMLGLFQWGIVQLSETENRLTSVERLLEYAKLEPEPSKGLGFLDD